MYNLKKITYPQQILDTCTLSLCINRTKQERVRPKKISTRFGKQEGASWSSVKGEIQVEVQFGFRDTIPPIWV